MDSSTLEQFVGRKQYLVLSTVRPDGRPHSALSAFLLHDDALWCPTMTGTVRARNLGVQPVVSSVITEGEGDEHAVVIVEGTADLVADGDLPGVVAEAWLAKFGWTPDWATQWICVHPSHVLSYAAEGWTL
jgi:general stress protein 26